MATENNTHINSFHKGMDTDTSYAALEEGKYSLAKNIRIVSTGYSDPTITNALFEVRPIRGVTNITYLVELGKPTITFDRILATNSIREYGLIVAAGKASDNNDKEWFVFSFNSNDVEHTLKLIFRSHKPTDKKRFSTVTKYEDTNIVKLYIATGEDPLIVLNILDEHLYERTLDLVRAYPAITFTPPKFKQLLAGGFLKPGLVQYSYRLYNKNGVSTDISPTTKLIPVVNYYGEEVNKAGVQGYLEEDQPSIGAEITIDIAPSYDDYLDRVQVFRIQYVHNGQLPTIECIQDTRVSTLREGNTLTIRDTANLVLSTLTLEEYNSMSGIHILPGIIESKYDYMFASKIKEESDWMTDEEYDAVTVVPELIIHTLAGDYSPVYNTQAGYITHNTISYTADDYSELLGYDCELHSYAEPEVFMNYKSLRRGEIYRYGVVFYNKYGEASKVKRLSSDIKVPYALSNLNDPDSIVGYDAFSTNEPVQDQNVRIELTTKPIGVRFTINNIPEEAVAYEIVRCNRTESDIKCLAQGVLSRPIKRIAADPEGDSDTPDSYVENSFKYPYTPTGYLTTCKFAREEYALYEPSSIVKDPQFAHNYYNNNVFLFISPETSYTKDSFLSLIKNKQLYLLPIVYLYPYINSASITDLRKNYAGGSMVRNTADPTHGNNYDLRYFNLGISGAGMFNSVNPLSNYETPLWAAADELVVTHLLPNTFGLFLHDGQAPENDNQITQGMIYALSNKIGSLESQRTDGYAAVYPDHSNVPSEYNTNNRNLATYAALKSILFGYIKLYNQSLILTDGDEYIKSPIVEGVPQYSEVGNKSANTLTFPNSTKIKSISLSRDLGWDDMFSVSGNILKEKYLNYETAVGNASFNNVITGGNYGTPTQSDNYWINDWGELIGEDNPGSGSSFYAVGGPCAIIQTEDLDSALVKNVIGGSTTSDFDKDVREKLFGTFLCNLILNVTPYGGDSDNSILLSTYYSYGNYHIIGEEDVDHSSVMEVYDGDCMIQPFEYMSAHKFYSGYRENTGRSFSMIYSIPVETNINLSYTLGLEFSKGIIDSKKSNLQLQPGNIYGRYIQDKPLYSYNSAYSSNAYTRAFAAFTELEDRNDLNDPDYRVYHSLLKSAKENIDNWTKFQPANFIDVDSKYGPVTDLKSFNNLLIFWQADAVGVLSVNERAVVSTDNNTPLILGTGGVLDRYDYIDKTSGMVEDQFVKANSDTTLYWWNDKAKQIFAYKTGSTVEELGKTKRVQNALYSKDDSENTPTMFFNNKYNEVVTNSLADKNQIAYSEFLQAFTSLYTFNYEDAVEFTDKDYLVSLHNNKGALRVSKYDDSDSTTNTDDNLMNAYLQYVVNKNVLSTKVFDNQELVTVNIPGGAGIERNEQRNKDTDSYFTQHHEYKWETDLNNSDTEELAMTLREGNYRYAIPRANNSNVGNRIRGKYMVCSIEDTNPNCDASISYIITKFRTSWS